MHLRHRAPQGCKPGNCRLGVLGGTFNPVTKAHLVLADAARTQQQLDEVVLVLPEVPPHKDMESASREQRLDMLLLATRPNPHLSVATCSHGLFLDMAAALKDCYGEDTELFFITGGDAAERILTWPYQDPDKALQEMFSSFQLLVFPRGQPFSLPVGPRFAPFVDRIHVLAPPEPLDHLSATLVRRRVAAGEPVDDLVPAAVADYIRQNQLYREQEQPGRPVSTNHPSPGQGGC